MMLPENFKLGDHVYKLIFFINFVFIFTVYGFDVKVLLDKLSLDSANSQMVVLESKHGFIIGLHPNLAVGQAIKSNNLSVSVGKGIVTVQNQPFKEKMVYIFPALSQEDKDKLQHCLDDWFEQNMQELDLSTASELSKVFDSIIQKTTLEASDYQIIVDATYEIAQCFLQDFVVQFKEPSAISVNVLMQYLEEMYSKKIVKIFLELIASEQLTKQARKEIEKNKQSRQEFFESKLYAVTQNILQDLLPKLPQKFLYPFFDGAVSKIGCNGYDYLGTFILFQENKKLLVINVVDIDDYLMSVVRHEGWPGWPVEMKKVMAVACRTYLVWQILQAQKLNRSYHIENGIKHQTYKGHCHFDAIRQAIVQTRDIFVAYDEKPALTMYDACCGGIIPAHIDDVGHKKVSYLARTYPCTFCKNFKIFHWNLTFTEQDVLHRLQKEFSKITKIISMTVQNKDKAGLVKKILINTGTRKITLTEKKFKTFFPEIKSYCFEISQNHIKRFVFAGKGFGHHKGLCQWGACKLVKDEKWNFEQVLQFYYPGTMLMRLKYQR